jgi:hypothetical protein
MLGVSLMALSACSTTSPLTAAADELVEVSPCENSMEDTCTLPNGGRPFQRVAFPDIKDWSSLRITLKRPPGFCRGCPYYAVTIAGDGTVSWHGEDYVKTKGSAVAQIAPERVRALFEAFRKAEFFWLFREYIGAQTDQEVAVTTIAFDSHAKTVTADDFAYEIGMPRVVYELEHAIDKTANTGRWIGPPDDPARQPRQD